MFKRDFDPLAMDKTYFLLGPRQTGKSTLLRGVVPEENYLDLLNPSFFREVVGRPETLVEIVQQVISESKAKPSGSPLVFVIDEIQKRPQLLDTVQYLLGKYPKLKFILTGSSARKLRSAGQNLLGGRARKVAFGPLTLNELSQQEKDPVPQALKYGGLPGVRSSSVPQKELMDYLGVYMHEEIMAESLIRNIGSFSRFLSVAGLCNSQQLNYEKIGSDAQVPGRTVRDYFDILEDTLIGTRLAPYKPRKDRKFVSSPKFYFFDVGVAHFLNKKSVRSLSQDELGKAFEQLVFCELKSWISYREASAELFYWRTQAGHEVDFVIRDEHDELTAIEVKLTKSPADRDLRGLRSLAEEAPLKRKILICNVAQARRTDDGCEILPIMKFVKQLWG